MNNLILFIIRYSAFLLFIVLEIIALMLVVRYNDYQRNIFVNSSSIFSGKLYNMADEVYKYNNLRIIADELASENAALKSRVYNLERMVQEIIPGDPPLDSCLLLPYKVIPAKVINNSINQRNNHFTIDKGEADSIRTGMGVISPHGVAGIVDHVGKDYATAISVLHSAARISASIRRNDFFGSLVWKELDPRFMILEDVPRQADVVVGDTIVTSGYSSIFPKGLFIGTVSRFWTEGGSNYHTIEVRLHEDIARLSQVYVVEYQGDQQ